MREIVDISPTEIVPETEAVLVRQGVAAGSRPNARIADLCHSARDLFTQLARPRGLYERITAAEFAGIYRGEGRNESATPLEEIYPQADPLALFVVTLGGEITRRIDDLFGSRDFALASMLDAAASEGAERLERRIERSFESVVNLRPPAGPAAEPAPGPRAEPPSGATHTASALPLRALTYSPGYCGWHVSGQRALFARLRPEEIGVTLRESFLMEPLKSISGVIVAAAPQVHDFHDAYPFCSECTSRTCRERIRRVLEA